MSKVSWLVIPIGPRGHLETSFNTFDTFQFMSGDAGLKPDLLDFHENGTFQETRHVQKACRIREIFDIPRIMEKGQI